MRARLGRCRAIGGGRFHACRCLTVLIALAAVPRADAGGGNQPPQIVQGDTANLVVGKNTACPNISNRIRVDATDPDGTAANLVWSLQTPPATGTVSFLTTNPRSFVITCYQPNSNQNAADSYVVRVTDPGGASDSITVNVTVTNLPPDIAQGASLTIFVGEDSTCPGAANEIALSAADPDGPSSSLNWTISTPPAAGTAGLLGSPTGPTVTLCYAPAPDQELASSFVVRVADDLGQTDTITINVNINAVPDCPVIAQSGAVNMNIQEDSTCGGTGNTIVLSAADPDTTAGSLQWSASTPASGLVTFPFGQTGASVQVCYSPAAQFFGADAFQVSVSDGTCGASDSIAVSVQVASIPDCPLIAQGSNAALTVDEDSLCAGAPNRLILSATDADTPPGSLAWQSSVPAQGSVSFLSGLTGGAVEVCYLPLGNVAGPDAFTVSVSDGDCGPPTAIQVSVTINPINDCPVMLGTAPIDMTVLRNSACGGMGNTITLQADDVDTSTGTLAWSATLPVLGVASFPAGTLGSIAQLCYAPNPGATGQDTFEVRVSDGACSIPRTVQVTIQCGIQGGADCNNNQTPDDCETDTDGDGAIDDCDGCPNDPLRTVLGPCGCGLPAAFDCQEWCEASDIAAPALLSCVQNAAFPERRCDGSLPPRLFVGRTDAAGTSKILRIRQDCTTQLYGPLLTRPESVLVDVNNYWLSGCPTQMKVIIGRYDGQGRDFLNFVNLLNGTICEQYTDDTIQHVGQMALTSSGRLIIGSVEGSSVRVLEKGVVLPFFTAPTPSPRAVTIDAADTVYVTGAIDGIMRKLSAEGVILGESFASGLQGAISQAIGPPGLFAGRIYVACGDRLMSVDPSSGSTETLATGLSAHGAAFDSDGYLYLTSPEQNRIVRIGPRPADINRDGDIDETDIPTFVDCLLGGGPAPPWHADVNRDGCADGLDIQPFASAMITSLTP